MENKERKLDIGKEITDYRYRKLAKDLVNDNTEEEFTKQLLKLKEKGVEDNKSFVTSKDVENLEEEFKEITEDNNGRRTRL